MVVSGMRKRVVVENKYLECLKYAIKNGYKWDEKIYSDTALNGHLECLKYAHENGCEWYSDTCDAALNGHLECLKYAHKNGCSWDEKHVVMQQKMDIWNV